MKKIHVLFSMLEKYLQISFHAELWYVAHVQLADEQIEYFSRVILNFRDCQGDKARKFEFHMLEELDFEALIYTQTLAGHGP